MNRQQLEYEIMNFSKETQICGDWEIVINTKHIGDIIDIVQQNTNEWVSVKDELPTVEKYGEKVWLWRHDASENQGIKMCIFDTKMVRLCSPNTSFMRLPTPPRSSK